ncbi:Transcription termination factor, mitochondrial, partial [Pseudolycoriella hygida]
MLFLRRTNVFFSPRIFPFLSQLYSLSTNSKKPAVLTDISQILSCSEETARNVCKTFPTTQSLTSVTQIKENVNFLIDSGTSKDVINANLNLLAMENGVLQRKLQIIKRMQPRHIDDFIPLLDIKEPILEHIAAKAKAERKIVPDNNRIYYLSKELQLPPSTVSKCFSKYNAIFFTPFNFVQKKLNILLDYDVGGEQILRSLYIFECAHRRIISRLEDLSSVGLYEVKLWYFKCSDEEFKKVLATKVTDARPMPVKLAHILKKRNLEKSLILSELNLLLQCDDKLSAQIYYDFVNTIEDLSLAKENMKLFTDYGLNVELIRRNFVVLTLPKDQIIDNIELIGKMRPNAIEDFLPLVQVDTWLLKNFVNVNNRRNEMHPIYFFSEKLNIPPSIVSKTFAEHATILFRDSDGLKKKLDLLLSYNVRPETILRSPSTFWSSLEFIENRLQSLRSKGIENISSWMLVRDETTMEKVAARVVEEKQSLGDSNEIIDYLAKRLNWDKATEERVLRYHPPLAKCSVVKVKKHLDYLLNETHFTVDDINSNPAVFRSNLNELKLRINELREIGVVPKKLYTISLSQN